MAQWESDTLPSSFSEAGKLLGKTIKRESLLT